MTKEQWKQRVKNKNVPIRIHIGHTEVPIDSISYIGPLAINNETLIANFDTYMKDGSVIHFYYKIFTLETIYERKYLFFKCKTKDMQKYFVRNCETLQYVEAKRVWYIKTIMQYKRFMAKGYHLV